MSKLGVGVAILALLTFGVLPMRAHAQVSDPVGIITTWVKELDAYDFDAAVALLADRSFVILILLPPDTEAVYKGKEEIRQALESYKEDNTRIQLVGTPHLENGTIVWIERRSSDSLKALGINSVDILGEGLMAGGKIKAILYSLTPESAARVQAALASGKVPTGMPRTGSDADLNIMWLLMLGSLFTISGLLLRIASYSRHGHQLVLKSPLPNAGSSGWMRSFAERRK